MYIIFGVFIYIDFMCGRSMFSDYFRLLKKNVDQIFKKCLGFIYN